MLGSLSAKYESSGNPAAVSSGWGDAGGKSYGAYQLASNVGSVHSFLRWGLNSDNNVYNQYAAALNEYEVNSLGFVGKWEEIGTIDPQGFFQMQHDYIEYAYYNPAISALRSAGFNIENHNEVMKDVVWSRAVQYASYIVEIFEDACEIMGYPNLSYIDAPNFDEQLIKAIYLDVCSTEEWTNGSPSLREGLYNRFENECREALARL